MAAAARAGPQPRRTTLEPQQGADLANLAPRNVRDLRGHVRRSLLRLRLSPNRLAAAFDHAGLPL